LIDHSRVILAVSDNNWTTNDFNIEWLKYFHKHNPPIEIYRLFRLDNHGNHVTFRFVMYAHDHKIILELLSHSTYRLQSLDIGIFDPRAIYYDQFVKERNRYEGKSVIKRDYMEWILLAYLRTNSEKNIASAL
jgi:hypothetical protein